MVQDQTGRWEYCGLGERVASFLSGLCLVFVSSFPGIWSQLCRRVSKCIRKLIHGWETSSPATFASQHQARPWPRQSLEGFPETCSHLYRSAMKPVPTAGLVARNPPRAYGIESRRLGCVGQKYGTDKGPGEDASASGGTDGCQHWRLEVGLCSSELRAAGFCLVWYSPACL